MGGRSGGRSLQVTSRVERRGREGVRVRVGGWRVVVSG